MREEHKEADDGDADDAAVYTEDDEEIGTAFCVGVGSTLKRRLTEVVMWRSRRGGDGGDKQIQSMLEIYGNSSSSAASSRPAMGGYGGGRMEQGKRRSLGTSSFTSAMIASIYHPIPEASPLQPSLSEGAPLTAADNRRATWSRTMSTPFKGRRVPVSTADLSPHHRPLGHRPGGRRRCSRTHGRSAGRQGRGGGGGRLAAGRRQQRVYPAQQRRVDEPARL